MIINLSERNHTMANERLVEAVNYMIEAPNYAGLVTELNRILDGWDTHPMAYGGKTEVLNALLDVGLANREAFDKLIALADAKRKLRPAVRRVAYQRDLMRERRSRMAKSLELHELQFGPLRGAARTAKMQSIQERWAEARQQFIASKGELSWADRNAAANEFWATVDSRLEINLQAARRERMRASA